MTMAQRRLLTMADQINTLVQYTCSLGNSLIKWRLATETNVRSVNRRACSGVTLEKKQARKRSISYLTNWSDRPVPDAKTCIRSFKLGTVAMLPRELPKLGFADTLYPIRLCLLQVGSSRNWIWKLTLIILCCEMGSESRKKGAGSKSRAMSRF